MPTYSLKEILAHAKIKFEDLPQTTQEFVNKKRKTIEFYKKQLTWPKIVADAKKTEQIKADIEDIEEIINDRVIADIPEIKETPPPPPLPAKPTDDAEKGFEWFLDEKENIWKQKAIPPPITTRKKSILKLFRK